MNPPRHCVPKENLNVVTGPRARLGRPGKRNVESVGLAALTPMAGPARNKEIQPDSTICVLAVRSNLWHTRILPADPCREILSTTKGLMKEQGLCLLASLPLCLLIYGS